MLNFSKIFICLTTALFLCGCAHGPEVINTGKMPGRTFSGITAKKQQSVKRARSGLYIIKDETTTNNTGVNFDIKAQDQQMGPGEVRFDYEDFRTRY